MKNFKKIVKFLLTILIIIIVVFFFKFQSKFLFLFLIFLLVISYLFYTKKIKYFFKLQFTELQSSLSKTEKVIWFVIRSVFIGILVNIFSSIVYPGYEKKIDNKINVLINGVNRLEKKIVSIEKEKTNYKFDAFPDYTDLKLKLKRYRKLLTNQPNDKSLIDDINEIENKIKAFQKIILELSNDFRIINIDYSRLKKVDEFLKKGQLQKAIFILDEEKLLLEQNELLKRKNNSVLDSVRLVVNNKLFHNAKEFVTKAKLQLLNLSNPKRIEIAEKHFKQAIKSSYIGNLIYGNFLYSMDKRKKAIQQFDIYIQNYQKNKRDTSTFNPLLLSRVYLIKAEVYRSSYDYDNAELSYKKSISTLKSEEIENIELGISYQFLGDFYLSQGYISKAKKNISLASKYYNLYDKNNKDINISIARLLIAKDSLEKANKLILSSIEYYNQDKLFFLDKLNNAKYLLANILFSKKKYKKALNELFRLERNYKYNYLVHPEYIHYNYFSLLQKIGDIYTASNKFDLGLKYYTKSKSIIKSEQNKNSINNPNLELAYANLELSIANLLVKNSQKDIAVKYYNKANIIFEKLIKSHPDKVFFKTNYINLILKYFKISKDAFSIFAVQKIIHKMNTENPTDIASKEMIQFITEAKVELEIDNNKTKIVFKSNSIFDYDKLKKENTIYNNSYVHSIFFEKNENLTLIISDTIKKSFSIIYYDYNE